MLQVSHLSKTYGVRTILDDVSFVLNRRERAALVGANGAGKTTLLRIIAGLEQPDSGYSRLDSHTTLGYLPQGQSFANELTLETLVRQGVSKWDGAKRAMDALANRMEHAASDVALLDEYSAAVARFETLGGYDMESRIQEILRGLGLERVSRDLPIEKLSGGQRTRAGLARLLISEPDVLLLDEPTNHLDVQALEWLEVFLGDYSGAALIVSHDRTFLDRTVSLILELDDETHQLTPYHGDYTAYEDAKEHALEKTWAAYRDQQAEIRRLEQDIARTKEHALWVEKTTTSRQPTVRRYAKKVAKKALSREKKLNRYLESDDRIEKPKAGYAMKLEFGEMPHSGQMVLGLEDVGMRFGERWIYRHASLVLSHGERIALVGANGSGKTTLLRNLVGAIEPTQGRVRLGANIRIGYMPQEQETLDAAQTPLALIRSLIPVDETDARHFLHFFMFEGGEVLTPIGNLSYGERARLILAKLVTEKSNVLILDEPINHLDIPSREHFQAALDAFPGTILVAVHDRAFIDRFATGIWAIQDQTLRVFPDRASMFR